MTVKNAAMIGIQPVHAITEVDNEKSWTKMSEIPKTPSLLIRLVLLLGNPFEYFPHAEMCQHQQSLKPLCYLRAS